MPGNLRQGVHVEGIEAGSAVDRILRMMTCTMEAIAEAEQLWARGVERDRALAEQRRIVIGVRDRIRAERLLEDP